MPRQGRATTTQTQNIESMVNCGTSFAVVHESVWSQGVPASVVRDYPHEFTLVLDQERDDDETPMEEYASVCLHCLIDEHPELGRAIDLAKRTGSAYRVDGEWKEKNFNA